MCSAWAKPAFKYLFKTIFVFSQNLLKINPFLFGMDSKKSLWRNLYYYDACSISFILLDTHARCELAYFKVVERFASCLFTGESILCAFKIYQNYSVPSASDTNTDHFYFSLFLTSGSSSATPKTSWSKVLEYLWGFEKMQNVKTIKKTFKKFFKNILKVVGPTEKCQKEHFKVSPTSLLAPILPKKTCVLTFCIDF